MFRIDAMQLVGMAKDPQEGLVLSWLPDGLLIEMSKQKLEKLKDQYENQMDSLRGELETERRKRQDIMQSILPDEYSKVTDALRQTLMSDQRTQMDKVLQNLNHIHTQQIDELQQKHNEDIDLRLQALKVTLEQVYSSQMELVKSDLEQKRLVELLDLRENLTKEHKEELNKLDVMWSEQLEETKKEYEQELNDSLLEDSLAREESPEKQIQRITRQLSNEHTQLLQKIQENLSRTGGRHLKSPKRPHKDSEQQTESEDGDNESIRSMPVTEDEFAHLEERELILLHAEDVRKNLDSHRNEIAQLRSQMLSEYEQLLASRNQEMTSQTKNDNLEQESKEIRERYEEQIKTFQAKVEAETEELVHGKLSVDHNKELEELKMYYEKKVQNIEVSYEEEVNALKSKLHQGLSSNTTTAEVEHNKFERDNADALAKEQDFILQSNVLTALSDVDRRPPSPPKDIDISEQSIHQLEQMLDEKDALVRELHQKLEFEEAEAKLFEERVEDANKKLKELEEELDTKDQQIRDLKILLKEKDESFLNLDQEKCDMEEKLRKDIEETENTQQKILSEFKEQLERVGEDLKVTTQNKCQLKMRIEELLHEHQQALEDMHEDIEHDNKREIETMQSEFKVQLEVELKHQAAELTSQHEKEVGHLQEKNQETEKKNDIISVELLREQVKSEICCEYEEKISHLQKELYNCSASLKEDGETLHNIEDEKISDVQKEVDENKLRVEVSREYENIISKMNDDYEKKIRDLELTLQEASAEKDETDRGNSSNEFENRFCNLTREYEEKIQDLQKELKEVLSSVGQSESREDRKVVEYDIEEKLKTELSHEYEENVVQLRKEYDEKMELLRQELQEIFEAEKDELSHEHRRDLAEAEDRYDTVIEGIRSGDIPEVAEMLHEKYDQEMEMAKTLMQQEFDETLEAEQARFMEQHQEMMDNFVAEQQKEAKELINKHKQEMSDQRENLVLLYEGQIVEFEEKCASLLKKTKLSLTDEQKQGQSYVYDAEEESGVDGIMDGTDVDLVTYPTQGNCQDLEDEVKNLKINLDKKEVQINEMIEEKTQLEGTLLECQEKHLGEIEQVKANYEEQINKLKSDLHESHTEELEVAALATDAVKSDLDKAHEQELEDMEEQLSQKYIREMDHLKLQHQLKVDELEEKHKIHREIVDAQLSVENDDIREIIPEFQSLSRSTPKEAMDTGISEGELSKVSFFDEEEVEEIAHAEGGSYEASECSSTPADLLGTIAFTEDQTNLMLPTPMQSLSDSGKDEIITELEAKLESLTGKLKEQMDGETLILARRERENEEGGNLVALLRTDLDHVNRERDTVQRTNEHLLKLLSDAVKTYMTIEDDISRKLTRMVSDQSKDRSPGAHLPVGEPASVNENGRNGGLPRDPNVQETSILSNITDEGLELSQRISESIFQGPELDEDGEELVADSGNRVQSSVAQLLGMIDDTTNQLVEAKSVHQELLDTLALRTQESEQATARCQDIEDRLKEEVDAKEYLALELHKAEGLIEGYSSEREILEKQLHELEEKKEELVLDLEMTRNKLCDLESAHDEAASLRDEMQRQQTVMQENVGGEAQVAMASEEHPVDGQALMLEVTRLNEDRRDLQQQLKQLQERYESRIHDLETAGEDMERHYITLFEEKKKEIEDLQLQLDNVEKQLKSSKQFIDEQMAEREQEREESQHEIDRLKEFVQSKEKKEEAENRLQREIEDLKQQLERHNDSHSETLLHKEQLERDLQDKSMTAQDMTSLVTQLEQEIEEKAAVEEQLRQKMKQLSEELVKQQDLCDTLSHNITPSPEPCSHASPEHTAVIAQRIANQQSRVPLEEELEKVKQQEEDLIHEKEALQQQVDQQHNQISALRNQLDEMRHRGDFNDDSQVSSLHEKLTETNEALEEKDSKLSAMMEKVLYQDDLIGQKEQQIRNHKAKIEELHGADFDKLQLENDILRNKLQSLEKERDSDPNTMEALSQNLLEEKNEEIDLLTKQISDLQTEVLVLKAGQEFENMTIELEKLRLAEMERARSTPASFSGDVSLTDADAAQLLNLSTSEKVSIHREIEDSVVTKLELISDLENDVLQLRETLQLKEVEIVDLKKLDLHASLVSPQAHSEELTMLNELLQEKEGVITEMTEQIDTLHGEVENLTDFQTKLQEDFDTVQGMLEDKQREIEHLSRDDTNKQDSDLQLNYDEEMSVVRKGQHEKDNVIGERDEEIYTLNEKLEQQESQIGELQKDIVDRHTELNQRQQEIEDLRLDVVAYENLKARLLERESDIRDKDEEIQILTEKSASLKEHLQIAENLQKKLEEAGLFNPDQRVAQNDMEKKRLREEVAALKQRLESDEKSTVLEESVAHISNLKEERSDDTDRIGSNQNESLLAESEDQLKQMREEMKTAQDESDVQLNMKVNQIAELHQELANVRTQWEMDTKLAEEHQQKIIEKDSLIQDKEVETKILKEEINDLQKDLDAIRQKLDAAESAPSDEIGKELIVLQEELTRIKEQASVIIDLENNLKNTRDQVKMKEEQMRQLEIECENSKQEMLLNISRLEGQVDQMQNGNGNDEWNQLNQLTELTEKLNKSDVKMQELTEQLDQRNNDIKQLQTELWETTSRLNSVTEKLEVSDEKLQQSCSQLSEREKHLECLQEELQLRQQTGDQDITKNIQEMATRLEESKQADLIICEKDAELNDIKQRLKEAVEISEQQLQIVEEKDVEYVQLKMDIQQTINEKDKSNKELKQQLHKAQVDKQNEMLKLQQESDDLKQQLLKVLDNKENEVLQLRQETDKLQKSLIDKDVAFQEMNEDLKEMKQQRDSVTIEKDSEITKLNTEKGAVLEKTKEIAQLQAVIQLYEQKNEMVAAGDTTIHLLRTDLQERDNNIQSLETRLEQSQTHIEQKQNEIIQLKMNMKTKMEDEENNGNMENIQQLKRELHETKSALAQLQYPDRPAPVGTLEGHTDIERKQLEEELVEVYRELDLYKSSSSVPTQDYIRKLMELSEKHQHHLQDVQLQMHEQSRAQLTELQKKQEEEVEKLKHFHQIEVEQKVGDAARELKKHNQTEMNQILSQHQKEIERIRRRAIDTDNIEAEHQGLQLQSEVDVTERLDRQLMDRFSTRPEGLGRDSVDASFADSRLNDISHDSSISDQIKSLLSRMYSDGVQMLTLSELQFLNHHMSPDTVEQDVDFRSLRAAWANEKQGFVSAIQSLKDLLAQTHRMRGLDKAGDVSDWRGELLKAIGFVFAKERDSLLAELRSHVVAHPSEDLTEVQKLEQKIRTQESHQQAALEQTLSADRQSMLAEIRDLRAHTSISRIQHQEERERLSEQLTSIEDQTSKRERHLKRQIQLLEYKLQQEKILQNDVKTSLDVERSRTSELSSRLNREKNMNLDFQTENSSMSMQLTKLKDALEREQSRFVSVTSALEEEKGKTASLTDTLEVEQDKLRHAEAELQTVRTITIQGQNLESHNMEKMKEDLTKERERRIKAENKVEVERIIIETLREELAIRSESIDSMDADFEPRLSQLKSALDSEKTKVVELSCALEHEKLLYTKLQQSLEGDFHETRSVDGGDIVILDALQAELDSEKSELTRLHSSLQREKTNAADMTAAFDALKRASREELKQERATCHQMKRELDDLQLQQIDLNRRQEHSEEYVNRIKAERNQVQMELKTLKELENERERRRDEERIDDRRKLRKTEQARDDCKLKQHEHELESQRLKQKCIDLEQHMTEFRDKEIKLVHELEESKLQSHQPSLNTSLSVAYSPHRESREQREHWQIYSTQLESICQSLQFFVLQLQEQIGKRQRVGVVNADFLPQTEMDCSALQRSLKGLLTEIRQIETPLSLETEGGANLLGTPSVNNINERILDHNAELTFFVSRLSDDKMQLRQTLSKLEEEIWQYRQREEIIQEQQQSSENLSDAHMTERASWAKEQLSLQLSLNAAEREVERLQTDLRIERERRVASAAVMGAAPETDKEKMQRLYGKYLKAESFRKALIYQKKYLLLLLGGFQDCEETTLAVIARMGAHPAMEDVQRQQNRRPIFLFRSAARVIIAVFRMKYLMKKWRRATRVGSPVMSGTVDTQQGYMPNSHSYSPPRIAASPRTGLPLRQPQASYSADYPLYNVDLNNQVSSSYTPSSRSSSRVHHTPPTKDYGNLRHTSPSTVPGARRNIFSSAHSMSTPNRGTSLHQYHQTGGDDATLHDDYIQRLENLQHRLGSLDRGSLPHR